MASFPTTVLNPTNPTSADTLAGVDHAAQHQSHNGEIVAVETKIGTGASTPAAGKVFRGTGAGTSAWGALQIGDVTASTGSGSFVFANAPTLTSAVVATNFDMNGTELILDADGDTTITADTNDQIDIKIGGADDFKFTANTFSVLSGSTLVILSGGAITADVIAETTADAGVTPDGVKLHNGHVTTLAGTASEAPLNMASGTNLTSVAAGAMEFDGKVFYLSPTATSRAVNAAMIFTRNVGDFTGSNVNTAQPVFQAANDTLTVDSSTTYYFKGIYRITRAAGVTSHTISLLFAGTATTNRYGALYRSTSSTGNIITPISSIWTTVTTAVAITAASTSATENNNIELEGYIDVNAGGTLIPQFKYSVAPGGAPTIAENSYLMLIPVGTSGVTNVGNWA